MRARTNPGAWPEKRTREEIAEAYGLSIVEFNRYAHDFVQREGFDVDGNEYHTLHDWLTIDRHSFVENAPSCHAIHDYHGCPVGTFDYLFSK